MDNGLSDWKTPPGWACPTDYVISLYTLDDVNQNMKSISSTGSVDQAARDRPLTQRASLCPFDGEK
jgi:hypothetical protein